MAVMDLQIEVASFALANCDRGRWGKEDLGQDNSARPKHPARST